MDLFSAVRNREEISHILINLIKRYNKLELAFSNYAAPVEDTIVDGVTDKAPSQNAVYDALLTKASLSDVISMDNALQIQIDTKANIVGQIFTGDISAPNLSGTNTGDETTSSIQTKRPLKTIEGQSLEGAGDINLNKSDIGLSDVDNTSDLNKPISTATQTALNLKEDKVNRGIANGYAPLDGNNKVPLLHINDSLIGNVKWKGLYDGIVISSSPDASLNGQSLPAPSSTNTGWYFISNGTFTNGGLDYTDGDWIISNGITWDRVDNTDAVSTVFGRTGHVIATNGDYTTALVTETVNKNYQTDNQKLYNDATSSIQTQLNNRALVSQLNTNSITNNSLVSGATATDALNTLNTTKENKQTYIIYADDYANLTDAINATPAGGTLILGNHTYTGNISITRGNINIVGSKMPGFHATLDQLSGGTIINGPLIIDGNNVSISNLGIDSGTAQCVALNSGNPMEGLVMHDISATDINFNNTAENVIAIVKANTTMHALLFEGLANSTFRNVHGKGGDFGVVFKVSDSNASDIYGYESRTTNVYIKSDSYAPTLRSNFNNINSLSNVITASQPVAVHASTSNLFDVNVNNVNIYGGTRQFRLIAHPAISPTYVMSNVNVSNVAMENGVDVGLDLYGVIYNTAFNNILVRNTVSGQGVFSDFNGRGINFNNIRFDDNSGNNLDTAIDIRSYSILNNIVSIRNTDQTSLGGINLNNFANSSKIGEYVGNLKINGVSVNRDKLTGQGTSNYVPKYDTAGILKNSLFLDDGLNSSFNAPIYTLGAGWSIFSTGNTTGSGFLTQVNSVPALRSTSSSTNSSINELRNLSLNFGTNGTTRLTITGSGDASFTNTLTVPNGTTSNHAVNKSQLDLKANLASPTFTGNPTAPTPTAGDNDTSIANTAFVTGAIATAKPYKVYVAVLSQSGTNAPTATVLENTLGGTVVWSRNSVGFYTATLSGAFTVNKFFAMSNLNYISFNANYIGVQNISRIDSDSFFIKNYLDTGSTKSLLDDLMAECFLEIRVYQ